MRRSLAVAAILGAAGAAGTTWDMSSSTAKMDGEDVVFQGLCISCLEYTCSSDAPCAQLLLSRDVGVITDLLLGSLPADAPAAATVAPRVVPTIRLALTAEYYLGDVACNLGSPNHTYASYVDAVAEAFTSSGVVVILDLHWNIAALAQTSMALDINSARFWTAAAARHGANPLVFYEIYNEPFLGYFPPPSPEQAYDPYECFRDGGEPATCRGAAAFLHAGAFMR